MYLIIQNIRQLATSQEKRLALSMLESGLEGALPRAALKRIVRKGYLMVGQKKISLERYERVYVVAIGKAADSMTREVNLLTCIDGGIVVLPENTRSVIRAKKFTVIRASHPIPSKKSVIAARRAVDFLKSLKATDMVIFLISGGASSLLALPDGISLSDKQRVTDLLLKSGANIRELNCIRKHLSKVKGGRLIESCPCAAVSLVMSDVVGDDMSVIASGLTYCDRTTFSDAKKILLKYSLKDRIPKPVWQRIILGSRGVIPETPKRPKIPNYIIMTNKDLVNIMKTRAKKMGLATRTISVEGDVKDVSSRIMRNFVARKNSCLIFGGETTVTVRGQGKGGRNQELVLHLLKKLGNKVDLVVASVGTDGIDGNTDAAGALADSSVTLTSIDRYLDKNDSYCYFGKYGGLIFTGPTHTNLMDIGLILQK